MPHKHKRKRGDEGEYVFPPSIINSPYGNFVSNNYDSYELPPSQRAQPLPARPTKGQPSTELKKRGKSRRKDNDTPRSFRRIMAAAQGKKFRSGLDDGSTTKPAQTQPTQEAPRIRPGEDLRSFAARVDAELPVSGLTRKTVVKDGKDEQGVKVYRTRKEMKMHKLYDQWREEERKMKEKHEEELELEAERDLENDGAGVLTAAYLDDEQEPGKKKKKKSRGKQDDDDPWAELKKKRAEGKIGLHDVAKAPPELNKNKSRQLKIKDGAAVDVSNIPKAAGSLRQREELQQVRTDVLEAYRKIREHEQAKLTSKTRPR